MESQKLYLKSNLVAEPLVNQWYVLPELIPPATAAMYTANSQLKIMESFVNAPQVHMAALKNPQMMGGPFVDYDESRVDDIKALIHKVSTEYAPLMEFAEAFKNCDRMLQEKADGYSLELLYHSIPDALKGYVELVYDLNNQPSIRLIEGLLYHSRYYDTSSQSLALFLIEQHQRPFHLSTPWLAKEQSIQLQIPFKSVLLDELFAMRTTPQSYDYIKNLLNIVDTDEKLFSSFFTPHKPSPSSSYQDEEIRIRYFGHACILIESKDFSILCDPLIGYQCEGAAPCYSYADLPEKIDYVLITHTHSDHFVIETLLQLRHKIGHLIVPKSNGGSLADPSLKLIAQQIGFSQVSEIDEMETIKLPGQREGKIIGLPFLGEHTDLNIRSKMAYLVTLEDKSILAAADSNNIQPELYQHIHKLFGNVDVIFLGMECEGAPLSWGYGPLLTKSLPRKMDQSRRFDGSNYEKALQIVKQLSPQQVYIYAMGAEPWVSHLIPIAYNEQSPPIVESNKLIEACRSQGIVAERLFGTQEIAV